MMVSIPTTTLLPAHHGGDSFVGNTATTGGHLPQPVSAGEPAPELWEKRQQWRKAGTQLCTHLINRRLNLPFKNTARSPLLPPQPAQHRKRSAYLLSLGCSSCPACLLPPLS